jgi:hypothetical protein
MIHPLGTFKMVLFWSAWTAQVQSRVLRDIMSIQRLAQSRKVDLLVFCDPVLRGQVESLGVQTTDDATNPSMVNVYVMNGLDIPEDIVNRLPEGCEPKVYNLFGDGPPERTLQMPDEDPYAGVKFYSDAVPINETMPLEKGPNMNPNIKHPEPIYSPWL